MNLVSMDKDRIKTVIPHREPMLLIDEISEMIPEERIRARLFLDPAWDIFKGHFPQEPVMPGVLTVEAMAQAADVLILSMKEYEKKTPLFIGIDQVRFKEKLCPGEWVDIEARIEEINRPKAVITCGAAVYREADGAEAAVGLVTLAMR